MGNTVSLPVVITEDFIPTGETAAIERAFDLTGYTAYLAIKRSYRDKDSEVMVYKTWTDHTNAEEGETLIRLEANETSVVGSFDFEFGIINADGEVTTIMVTKIHINPVVKLSHS